MATKLFLRDTTANAIGVFKDMLIAAGAASTTGVVNTAASGTEIQWTQTAGGTVLEFISGRVPAGGFTLAGTMTFSIWARESNMNANCGGRSRVFKRTAAGSESEIGGGPYNDGVEFGTAAAEMVWTGTPTSTAFSEDDRIICRYYITNIGTMASGHTCTLTYNAADAATDDSFFQITENVTFKAESVTHATSGALSGSGAAIVGSAAHIAKHATTGALVAAGALIVGSAAHIAAHPTSGALIGQSTVIVGTAARTRAHPSSGVLAGQASVIVGAAARTRQHATTGTLSSQGAVIVGAAARATGTTSHASSGSLAGPGALLSGVADHVSAGAAPGATPGFLIRGPIHAGFKVERDEEKQARRAVYETPPQAADQAQPQPDPVARAYYRKSAQLAAGIARLRAEAQQYRARIAELEAAQDAEQELLRQRQALLLAQVQEAVFLEEMEVIDVAYFAAMTVTMH